jgi:hypothetical protein
LAAALASCGWSFKSIVFDVHENGKTVTVEKPFGSVDPSAADAAFEAVQRKDVDGAIRIMQAAAQKHPQSGWHRYNLAILYEVKGDWTAAHEAIEKACEIEPTVQRFKDELAFVERHMPKASAESTDPGAPATPSAATRTPRPTRR